MEGCLVQIFVRIGMALVCAIAACILLMPLAFLGNIVKILVILAAIYGLIFGPSILKDDK